jgi:hypothetical protein
MKKSLWYVVIMSAFVLAPGAAEAQFCVGSPSFRDQPYQVGVAAAFTDGARGVSGEFAAGGEALFAGGGVGVVNFDDFDATATNIFGFGGADLGVDQRERVFVCPLGRIGFGVGPDIGAADVSTFSLQVGGSVGVIASQTNTLMVIPNFGLALHYDRVTVEFGGEDESESDSSGLANIGVGFVFNRNVGITPSIAVPFSAGDSDVIFTVSFTFHFGQ